MNHNERAKKVQQEINDVSPSFCVAKWKQVTMHLQNGHTHSCHHPGTHYVSVNEIKRNPTALHNSEFKKTLRKQMLEGVRPTECDYCWRVEDAGEISDRTYKSSDPSWAYEHIQDIATRPWDDNIDPSYVEVSFSNVCNFKCSYCSPNISSQWMEEIERHGAYPTSSNYNDLTYLQSRNQIPIPNREENPYVDAFWNWFPDMYKSLKHFRITGGEPLLSKDTFKVLDYIIANPNPDLEVSINTNMNPPKELFNRFLEKVKIIINEKKVKRFKLFTSAEAHGKQAEYIRHGMNYNEWLENIHHAYKEIPTLQFTIMSTYNILSLTTYIPFLQDILAIKKQYGTATYDPVLLDIPYLRYPSHQSIFIMEPLQLELIKSHYEFMCNNTEGAEKNRGFHDYEIEKLKRIYNTAVSTLNNQVTDTTLYANRKDFTIFVDEHDKRRGTNFLETFPELEDFYELSKGT